MQQRLHAWMAVHLTWSHTIVLDTTSQLLAIATQLLGDELRGVGEAVVGGCAAHKVAVSQRKVAACRSQQQHVNT